MPASHLSVICSSFAVCITTIKFAVPAWRLYYEYTRKPKPKPVPELTIRLDTGMSAIFVILSWLLLAFSLTRLENGLQIVLSLAEGSTIVYQVGLLWLYRPNHPRALWALLICFIVAPIITVIPLIIVGHIKASKIILLSFFLAEYFGIFIIYLVPIWFEDLLTSKSLFLWNMGLCCVAWVGALGSLVGYLEGKLDFITFLWIDNATALVWVVWILWRNWTSLQRVRSQKGSNEELGVRLQDDSPRQDSTTQLVAPSAVHYV